MRLAASAVLLVVVAGACSSQENADTAGTPPPVPATVATPAITTSPSATTPTTTTPATTPPATSEVAPPTSEPVAPSLDYDAVAGDVVEVDTPLGRMRWIHATHVPGAWLDAGFPSIDAMTRLDLDISTRLDDALIPPCCLSVNAFTGPDRAISTRVDEAFAGAPCCLTIHPMGEGRWIGIGTTTWSDEDRQAFLEGDSQDVFPYRCRYPWRIWQEVWFSADGHTWEPRSTEAFGETGIDPCEGSAWVIAGADRVLVVQVPTSAMPFVADSESEEPEGGDLTTWVSDDLSHWSRGTLEIDIPKMATRITGGAAISSGWAIFGMRVSKEPVERSATGIPLGPFTVEWAGWMSADGITWQDIDAPAVFGEPPCTPAGTDICGWIQTDTFSDAVVAYLRYWQEGESPSPFNSWVLWIGILEDPPTG